MRSTFMGLETAKRGMTTQQTALYVTGHNISNANSLGYTRQSVNFSATSPYAAPGMNRPGGAGQIGTGVEAGSITRIRESFTDVQFRGQNNKVGYYGSLTESLTKMEEIMNEPSESGLQSTMEKFWNSLQTLAGNTENIGARSVVASTGQMVADTFNYYYNSLTRVQSDIGYQLNTKVTEINALVSKIDELNKQISEVEPHGMLPNDLYDARDLLVDELSGYVNIKVTKVHPDNYGNALPIAEGLYNIELVQADGSSFGQPGTTDNYNLLSVTPANGIGAKQEIQVNYTDKLVSGLTVGSTDIAAADFLKTGELSGLIESFGYGDKKGLYPDMLDKLNKLTVTFANEFNEIHRSGYALNDSNPSNLNFFVFNGADTHPYVDSEGNAAQLIKVNDVLINDQSKIAAGSEDGNAGNNKNAQIMADLKTKDFSQYKTNIPVGLSGNVDSYYAGIIGSMGVTAQSANQNYTNSSTIAASIEQRRQSTSAVSLDEEMVNMIKFQHAYNASARNITVVDEMLDKIINGMGVVGR